MQTNNDRTAQRQPAPVPHTIPAGTLSEAEIRQIVSEILG